METILRNFRMPATLLNRIRAAAAAESERRGDRMSINAWVCRTCTRACGEAETGERHEVVRRMADAAEQFREPVAARTGFEGVRGA